MKKLIVFKSILVGTLALSTFNAQAGVFTIGRALFGAAAASTLAGMYKGATTTLVPNYWEIAEKLRLHENTKPNRRKKGAAKIFAASVVYTVAYASLHDAAQRSRDLSNEISNNRKRASLATSGF